MLDGYYDGNGNELTQTNTVNNQHNKTFTYNLLNLPQSVVANTGTSTTSTLTYTYDATGNKLRRTSTGLNNTTDYINGIQYDGATTPAFNFIQTEEGKAVYQPTTGGFEYEYYLGDNLGNTRVTFGTKTGTAVLYQTDDYYPFGMEINSYTLLPKNEYLYNKKELQEELAEYDYGARFYDPVIGRWNVVDPLAEVSRRWSPYNYVSNNPISRIDPDGMTDYTIDQNTGKVKMQGKENNNPDRVLKTDSKGNVKKKGEGFLGFLVSKAHKGEAKVAFGGIEKGILSNGMNLKDDSHLINVGGTGQPSQAGVESFALKLSNYVNKEIGGTYFSKEGTQGITAIGLGAYGVNHQTETNSYGTMSGIRENLTLSGFFHTHPTLPNRDPSIPSERDKSTRDAGLATRPDLNYYLIYDGQASNGQQYIKHDFTKE